MEEENADNSESESDDLNEQAKEAGDLENDGEIEPEKEDCPATASSCGKFYGIEFMVLR